MVHTQYHPSVLELFILFLMIIVINIFMNYKSYKTTISTKHLRQKKTYSMILYTMHNKQYKNKLDRVHNYNETPIKPSTQIPANAV